MDVNPLYSIVLFLLINIYDPSKYHIKFSFLRNLFIDLNKYGSYKGVKEGGLPNPAYHFSRQLFGIHILHTKKSTSQILHTPYHFQTFKSPIPKKSRTISYIPKKMKDKSCFRIFYLGPKMFGNLLSSIIYRLQRGQRDSSITLLEMLSG